LNNLNELNIDISVSRKDANYLLSEIVQNIYLNSDKSSEYPHIISVDPFGTPNSYLDSVFKAIRKKNGLICITATDTAVLFGVRPIACKRKYMAKPLNCEFTKEIGARILLYFISRIANINDLGIKPLLTFYSKHFIRVFAITIKNKNKISNLTQNYGYLLYCTKCGYRFIINNEEIFQEITCDLCKNTELTYAGPIWTSNLHDRKFIQNLLEMNKISNFKNQNKIENILNIINQEISMPQFYYNTHKISKGLKLENIPKLNEIIESLNEAGYKSSRTHFDFRSLKSRANIEEISNMMKELSERKKSY
jgi:tRNA (guanine26-N2/guanine27-N2)-dimethyltransferase